MSQYCIHCIVKGHVQGVWFRAHTKEYAEQLDLTGWTRNLLDGSVEVLACGDEERLRQLQDWLWKGSPLSRVEEVIVTKKTWQEHTDFSVK